MAPTNVSPNVDEYYIGKGILTAKPVGGADWIDVGNVPEIEFTPNIDTLPHNSARAGTRVRDKTVVLEKGGELRIVFDEWTSFNMSIMLLGEEEEDPADTFDIDILSLAQFSAAIRFQGKNDIGPRWNFEFLRVDFVPSGSLNLISEEFGQIEVTGQLAAVAGVFGTARRMAAGGDPTAFA
jgi:hypothetical protein